MSRLEDDEIQEILYPSKPRTPAGAPPATATIREDELNRWRKSIEAAVTAMTRAIDQTRDMGLKLQLRESRDALTHADDAMARHGAIVRAVL